jgi:hypothetical protein
VRVGWRERHPHRVKEIITKRKKLPGSPVFTVALAPGSRLPGGKPRPYLGKTHLGHCSRNTRFGSPAVHNHDRRRCSIRSCFPRPCNSPGGSHPDRLDDPRHCSNWHAQSSVRSCGPGLSSPSQYPWWYASDFCSPLANAVFGCSRWLSCATGGRASRPANTRHPALKVVIINILRFRRPVPGSLEHAEQHATAPLDVNSPSFGSDGYFANRACASGMNYFQV